MKERGRLDSVMQDAKILSAQLRAHPMAEPLRFADQFTIQGLSMKTLDATVLRSNPVNLSVVDRSLWAEVSRADAIVFVEEIQANLGQKITYFDDWLAEAALEVQTPGARLSVLDTQWEQVQQDRAQARERYGPMANGLEEARILEADMGNRAQVASTAQVPVLSKNRPTR